MPETEQKDPSGTDPTEQRALKSTQYRDVLAEKSKNFGELLQSIHQPVRANRIKPGKTRPSPSTSMPKEIVSRRAKYRLVIEIRSVRYGNTCRPVGNSCRDQTARESATERQLTLVRYAGSV